MISEKTGTLPANRRPTYVGFEVFKMSLFNCRFVENNRLTTNYYPLTTDY